MSEREDLRQAVSGSAGTLALRKQYRRELIEAAGRGETIPDFEVWLERKREAAVAG